MSTDVATVGERLRKLGYHAAYQGKWHLSGNIDSAHKPVDAPMLRYRDIIETYGFDDFLGLGDLIDGPIGGYMHDNFATTSAVTWLRTKARELKAKGQPWFMAVNFVNPHDVMYVNSDAPGEVVQGKYAAYPIDRPPQNEIYLAEWDVPLPATRSQALDAPGRPRAHYNYQATQDILLGQWPNEDRRWRVLQNYYFNCIRDCDTHTPYEASSMAAIGSADTSHPYISTDRPLTRRWSPTTTLKSTTCRKTRRRRATWRRTKQLS